MPSLDGIKKRYSDSDKDPNDSVFSELFSNPDLEQKHLERIERFNDRTAKAVEEKLNEWSHLKLPRLKLPVIKRKTLAKVILVLSIFILAGSFSMAKANSLKDQIETLSLDAQNDLEAALGKLEEGNLEEALKKSDQAKQKLTKTKLLLQSFGQDVEYFKFMPRYNSKLIAGERLLDASFLMINTMSEMNNQLSGLDNGNSQGYAAEGNNYIFNIDKNARSIGKFIDENIIKLKDASLALNQAKPSLDYTQQAKIESGIETIDKTTEKLTFYKSLLNNDLPWLSGKDGQGKHVMIVFQNNAELRGGSGGSFGSFGVAHFSNGKLINIDFAQNIFKLDQAFEKQNYYEPPEIIKFLREGKSWTLKDSGWAVDGPSAMSTILDFYYKETGERLDGVMVIDTSAIVSLMKVVGPIDIASINKTITAENFRSEVEYEVHKGYFEKEGNKEENEPKKILAEMMPTFIDKVFGSLSNKDQAGSLIGTLSGSFQNKDILLYFTKDDFQSRINQLNLSGKVFPAIGDYLYVNNSNIDGAKSSLSVNQRLELGVKISKNGTTSNTLSIQREHTGKDVWPDGVNKNFVRTLLPQNARITEFKTVAGNFEQMANKGLKNGQPYWLDTEADKLSTNFWMTTKPGEKSQVDISYNSGYQLNTSEDFTYILGLQKQPGALADNVTIKISYPDGFKPVNVRNYDQKNRSITLDYTLSKDKVFRIKFKKI